MKSTIKKTSAILIIVVALAVLVMALLPVAGKYVKTLDGTAKDVIVSPTYKTVLYSDGSLVINETLANYQAKIASGMTATAMYESLNLANPYEFTSMSKVPWIKEIGKIKTVSIGSEIQPTKLDYWFTFCQNIKEIDFSNVKQGSQIKSATSAFHSCTSLKEIKGLSKFDTSQAEKFELMFSSTAIEYLDLSSFDTSNVSTFKNMFKSSKNLKEIKLGEKFVTSSATSFESMFEGCEALEYLDLSSFSAVSGNKPNPSHMFYSCYNLKTIVASEELDFSYAPTNDLFGVGTVGKTSSITGGMGTAWSSSHVGGTYGHLDGGTSNPGYFTDKARGYLWYKVEGNNLHLSPTEKSGYSDASLALKSAEEADVPWLSAAANVTTVVVEGDIFPQGMAYWFNGLSKLTTFSNMNKISFDLVGTISHTFAGCSSLVQLDLQYFDDTHLHEVDAAFMNCSSLTTIIADKSLWRYQSPFMLANDTFVGCTPSLVGKGADGTSTTWSPDKISGDYAAVQHYDGITQGYFTDKEAFVAGYWKVTDGTLHLSPVDDGTGYTRDKTIITGFDSEHIPWVGQEYANVVVEEGPNGEKLAPEKMDYWFCNNIESSFLVRADLSKLDTSKVTSMTNLFTDNYFLGSVDFGKNINTSNVTDMSYMFKGCYSLYSPDVSNFDTSKVENMEHMFQDCGAIQSIDIAGFNTENVKNMDYMFRGFGGGYLLDLNLSNFNTGNVESMESIFENCDSVESLDITNFDTTNVKNMTSMFKGCRNLVSIHVKNSFNTSKVTKADDMFTDCYVLEGEAGTKYSERSPEDRNTIKYARIDQGPESSAPGYFSGAPAGYWKVEGGTLYISPVDDGSGYTKDETIITGFDSGHIPWAGQEYASVVVEEGPNGKKLTPKMMDYWFYNNANVASVDFSNLCTTGAFSMRGLFCGCTNLTAVSLGENFIGNHVRNTSQMFSGCKKLASLDITSFNTREVINMESMFSDCSSLTTLDLYKFDTRDVTNMKSMFENCTSLTTIYANDTFVTTSISEDENMFLNCSVLKGEKGTPYSSSHIDSEYARIDQGLESDEPGYFTKSATGYWKIDDNYTLYLSPVDDGTGYTEDKRIITGFTTENTPWAEAEIYAAGVVDGPNGEKLAPEKMDYWFCNFSYWQTIYLIDLTKLDTSNVTSMNSLFYDCENLSTLKLGENFNTSEVVDMSNMFASCYSLESIDLSNFDTSKVKNMELMFSNCVNLRDLDVSRFDTSKVENMAFAFNNCCGLTSLDLSNFNTNSVKNMRGMFSDDYNLQTILAGDAFNVANVEESTYMFSNCQSLKGEKGTPYSDDHTDKLYARIDQGPESTAPGYFTGQAAPTGYWKVANDTLYISPTDDGTGYTKDDRIITGFSLYSEPPWAGETFTNVEIAGNTNKMLIPEKMDYWFNECSSIKSINLSNLDTSTTTSMSRLFNGCTGLTTLQLGENFKTDNVTDMSYMLCGCQNLETFDASKLNTASCTNMGHMFEGCQSLSVLDVSKFDTKNVRVMTSMFEGCKSVDTLDVSDFVTTSATNMTRMFMNCEGIKELDLSDFSTEKVTTIAKMFAGCVRLETLDLSSFSTDKIGTLAGEFSGCIRLYLVRLGPKFTISNAINSVEMFAGCEKLEKIEGLEYLQGGKRLSKITYMFSGCKTLKFVDLSGLKTNATTSLEGMFQGCSNLVSLDLSGFNTEKLTVCSDMFNGCSGLTKLDISGFDTTKVESINAKNMFNGCSSLKTIFAKDAFDSSKISNDENMFLDCESLEGGKGTRYEKMPESDRWSKKYACIDGGSSKHGYFTDKELQSKGYWGIDNGTLYIAPEKTDKATNPCSDIVTGFDRKEDIPWLGEAESIKEVSIQPGDTKENLKPIAMNYLFAGLTNCTSIIGLKNINTEELAAMNYTFEAMGIADLDLSDFDTSKVSEMNSTFKDCAKLVNLDLTGFNTENVTTLGHMFFGCSSLKQIDLSSFDTKNVTDLSLMFASCKSLTIIYVKDTFVITSPTAGTQVFASCDKLVGERGTKYIEMPESDRSSIRYAHIDEGSFNPGYFTDATNTGYWKVKDGTLYLSPVDDGSGYKEDKTIISGFDSKHIPWAGQSFTKVVVKEGLKDKKLSPKKMDWWFYTSPTEAPEIVSIDLSELNTSAVTSMKGLFSKCSELTDLKLGSNFSTSLVEDMSEMFIMCSKLTSIDLSNFDTSSAKNMSGIFGDCISLSSIDLSNLDTSLVEDTSAMFYSCSALKSVNLSNINTEAVKDMAHMFYGCSALESVDLSDLDTGKVKNMNGMFDGCSALKSLDLSNFDTSSVETMYKMFNNCQALSSLDISGFNTEKTTDMSVMFSNCVNLETIYAKDTFVTGAVLDDSQMFSECSALQGGQGTRYIDMPEDDKDTSVYAHIDGGKANPGYFTDKDAPVGKAYWGIFGTTLYIAPEKTEHATNLCNDIITGFKSKDDIPWLSEARLIYTVEIQPGVTNENLKPTTMNYLFAGLPFCMFINGLENINTEELTAMNYTFESNGIGELELIGFDTSNVSEMVGTFSNCTKLTALNLSGSFSLESVIKLNRAFSGIGSETTRGVELTFGTNCKTEKTEEMISTFENAKFRRQILDLSNFSNSSLKNINTMFKGCADLAIVYADPEKWSDRHSYVNYLNTFEGCNSLYGTSGYQQTRKTNVGNSGEYAYVNYNELRPGLFTKPETNTNAYWGLSDDFKTLYFCPTKYAWADKPDGEVATGYDSSRELPWREYFSSIEHVQFIPGDEGEKLDLQSMDYLLSKLENLQEIYGFDDVSFENLTSMQNTFEGSGFTGLDMSRIDTSRVTSMKEMFASCSKLQSLDLSDFNTENVADMSGMFNSCSNLSKIYASDSFVTTSVTEDTNMFLGCSALTGGLGTPYSDRHIDSEYARIDNGPESTAPGYFTDCEEVSGYWKVENGTLYLSPTNDESGYIKERGIILGFNELPPWQDQSFTDVKIKVGPNGEKLAPISMKNMFHNCRMQSVDLTNLDTSKTIIMTSLFRRCNRLSSINFGKDFDTKNVTSMRSMFEQSTVIKSLNLNNFNTKNVTDMSYMFTNCLELVDIYLTSFDTQNVTDMTVMFTGCTSLTTIYAEDSFVVTDIAKDAGMFYNCELLQGGQGTKYVDMPEDDRWSKKYACIDQGPESTAPGYFTDGEGPTGYWKVENGTLYLSPTNDESGYIEEKRIITGFNELPPWASESFTDVKIKVGPNGEKLAPISMKNLFFDCNMESVDLTNLDTRGVISMYGLFQGCSELTDIKFGNDFNTSRVKDMSKMFDDCESLVSLDLSSFNTGAVKNMSGMFYGCKSLALLDLSSFNTRAVEDMSRMFEICKSLASLDLSSFNTAAVKDMSSMFDGCSSLTTIYAKESFVATDETLDEDMFYRCELLQGGQGTKYVDMPEDDRWSKKYACIDQGPESDAPGYFTDCEEVSGYWKVENGTLYLSPTNDESGYIEEKGMITGFNELPPWASESFTRAIVKVGANGEKLTPKSMKFFFSFCNMKLVDLTNLNTRDVTSMYGLFARCPELIDIKFGNDFNTKAVKDMTGMFAMCGKLSSIDLSKFDTASVKSMAGMFSQCKNLNSIDLSKFNTAAVKDMSKMFYNCESLASLDLSSFNTGTVGDMSNMFYDCESLVSLDLSSFNTGAVEDMSDMFSDCESLTTIYAKESFVTTDETLDEDMFYNCELLQGGQGTKYVDMPEDDRWSKKYACIDQGPESDAPGYFTDGEGPVGYWKVEDGTLYLSPTNDESGYIEEKGMITGFNELPPWQDKSFADVKVKVGTNGEKLTPISMKHFFYHCNMESVDLTNLDTRGVASMYGLFQGCSELTDIKFGNDFNTKKVKSMFGMFAMCSKLSSIDLSKFDTASVKSMTGMFTLCENLSSIDLSKFDTASVEDMSEMFYRCESLVSLDLNNFDTASVEDMFRMFDGCVSLVSLDLSSFNTGAVEDMSRMFSDCESLATIYAKESFVTTDEILDEDMFYNCELLQGGQGTKYVDMPEDDRWSKKYACIDQGPESDAPGYFTEGTSKPSKNSYNSNDPVVRNMTDQEIEDVVMTEEADQYVYEQSRKQEKQQAEEEKSKDSDQDKPKDQEDNTPITNKDEDNALLEETNDKDGD